MKPLWILAACCAAAAWRADAGTAGPGAGEAAAWARLNSRLEEMAGRFVPETEWLIWLDEAEALQQAADRAGEDPLALDAAILLARGWGEVREDWVRAVGLLRQARDRRRGRKGMSRVYLAEAAFLARLGDTEGISLLIEEFRSGPDHDPRPFAWEGGDRPGAPLAVVRPRPLGPDSITLTALERARREARYAAGARFPPFDLRAADGRRWTSESLHGRVVVLDLWAHGAPASAALQPHLDRLAGRHGDRLAVVGICLNLDTEALPGAGPGTRPRPREHVGRDRAAPLLRALGVFGDAQVIVLDRDGRIAARLRDGTRLEREVARMFPAP